jgi:hypothetical protein
VHERGYDTPDVRRNDSQKGVASIKKTFGMNTPRTKSDKKKKRKGRGEGKG